MKRIVLISAILIASFIILRFNKTARHAPAAIPETLIIGTSSDFQPMAFKRGNEIVGFDIDLITEIGKRLNKTIILKDMPFEILLPQIQLGTIHVVAAGMSATPERGQHVIFSKPYITDNPLVAVTLSSKGKITNFEEIKAKKIVVNQGYVADTYLSKIPDLRLTRLPNVSDALMSLDAGRADVFVTAASSIKPVIELYGDDKYSLFILEETEENTALAISKEYPELAKKIDILIDEMIIDGTLNALKEKWHIQ